VNVSHKAEFILSEAPDGAESKDKWIRTNRNVFSISVRAAESKDKWIRTNRSVFSISVRVAAFEGSQQEELNNLSHIAAR